jgi:hypothetical protein
MIDKLTPAQAVMNAYNQRALATKRSTAVIGVLQTIVDQLATLKLPTSFEEFRESHKLCHGIGVSDCKVHILNIMIELRDSND